MVQRKNILATALTFVLRAKVLRQKLRHGFQYIRRGIVFVSEQLLRMRQLLKTHAVTVSVGQKLSEILGGRIDRWTLVSRIKSFNPVRRPLPGTVTPSEIPPICHN